MSQIEWDFSTTEQDEDLDPQEPHVYSVSELNGLIRESLEGQFSQIWIKGEISNFKAHSSGHFYFSLKDEKAQINAVMFRGLNSKLKFRPETGMEVLVQGKITVYEPRGNYQVFCQTMEPVGAGALQMAFEQLKKKLASEGLFAPERKKARPALPKHIAIVTSPTGAAIRDMLNVLSRRFKAAKVTVIPALVQGGAAAPSIVEGIQMANRLKDADVLIVGRGGGSMEDLWAFNEESVARAIVASRLPVISAVGHEVDFTIADFVADLRAPTPSAAAELVVKNVTELLSNIQELRRRLLYAQQGRLNEMKQKLQHLTKQLVDPRRRLQESMQRLDELATRLETAGRRQIQFFRQRVGSYQARLRNPKETVTRLRRTLGQLDQKLRYVNTQNMKSARWRLKELMGLLDSLSPLKVVDRGYSILKSKDRVISRTDQVKPGDQITAQVKDGLIELEVKGIRD